MNETNTNTLALISCSPPSEAFAAEEMREILTEQPAWLDPGLALVALPGDFRSFSAGVRGAAPVFVRHIAPVDMRLPLVGDASDLDALRAAAKALAANIDPDRTFAVQARLAGAGPFAHRKFDLNKTVSDAIEAECGARMDARAPQQVVSLLCLAETAYLGISDAEANLSDWPGGEHRFRTEPDRISRSEFKLLEAMSVFGLTFPKDGAALDIGASPGGWTHVLTTLGLNVVAVDPADLDPRLLKNSAVSHARLPIQDYLPCKRTFDVIVNDMRMDPLESVEIMLETHASLRPRGLAVMTLKLPEATGLAALAIVRDSLQRLRWRYEILGARQLYHNRSEVTVAMKARSGKGEVTA